MGMFASAKIFEKKYVYREQLCGFLPVSEMIFAEKL
jgi:hypothetical protein